MRAPGKIAARAPDTGSGNPKLPEIGVSSAVRKAFNEALHPRDANGRFKVSGNAKPRGGKGGDGQRKELVGQERLKTSGVAGDDTIEVLSKRVRKYQGATTVEQFVANHLKGRAYALRVLAADHKAGRIGFKAAEKSAEAAGTGRAASTTTVAIDPKLADGSFRANTERVDSGLKGDDFLISLNGSKRYPMGITVDQAAEAHPKGKAAGLKQIAADMKAGRLQAERTKEAKQPKPRQEKQTPRAVEGDERFNFGEGTSEHFQDQIRDAHARLPKAVQDLLSSKGIKIHAPRKTSQIDPDLAKIGARGYTSGGTYENAGGYYDPRKKIMVINELTAIGSTGRYKEEIGTAHTYVHEAGHAVDDALGNVSKSRAFRVAYFEDVSRFKKTADPKEIANYAYFLQSGDAGPSEMFAEQFAQQFQSRYDIKRLKEHFPRSAAYMDKIIKGL